MFPRARSKILGYAGHASCGVGPPAGRGLLRLGTGSGHQAVASGEGNGKVRTTCQGRAHPEATRGLSQVLLSVLPAPANCHCGYFILFEYFSKKEEKKSRCRGASPLPPPSQADPTDMLLLLWLFLSAPSLECEVIYLCQCLYIYHLSTLPVTCFFLLSLIFSSFIFFLKQLYRDRIHHAIHLFKVYISMVFNLFRAFVPVSPQF